MSGFHIYNASAGSGKTYQLTKTVLSLVLSKPSAAGFRQILALTFTNKAVAEMKNRIMESLQAFGDPNKDKTNNALFNELKAHLKLSDEALEKKSAQALKLLLHNYDFFEIATIDKFTHRVIRTFAKDLKLSQNFEVELDEGLLLDTAIGRLLQRASRDKKLEDALIHFALQKIAADKSWNIIKDLTDIGKLLFKENHYQALVALSDKEIKDFEELRQYLVTQKESLAKQAKELAQNALDTIYQQGFEDADFPYATPPKHFKKIIAGNFDTDNYNNKLEEKLRSDRILKAKSPKDSSHLSPMLLAIFLQIKQMVYQYLLLDNAHTNILPLTLLNEIAKEIQGIQKERDLLHISEFNKLIAKEIANQPVPYIYERLGERYRHYFIDEFQDTSTMQWQNLVPLIGNALETETLDGQRGSLMLVGDVKQSIYRWRGGDPKQMLSLNETANSPFSLETNNHTLDTNWRSCANIINFNNDFFAFTAGFLKETQYQDLYTAQCQQRTNHRAGGYIEALFLQDKDTLKEDYCQQTLTTIQRIKAQDHAYKDICILVRKKDHGLLIADFLMAAEIPIISSEALLLANNPEVLFLIALLRFMDNPEERLPQYEVLAYLYPNQANNHDPIAAHLGQLDGLLQTNFNYHITKERTLPVLHILERAIAAFNLSEKCGAHLIHLLDFALDIGTKNGVGIHQFLYHWELKEDSLAITVPADQDAIQIMTIHKSKGLEFPFVIFPFADSPINSQMHKNKFWVPLAGAAQHQFDKVLVSAKKELPEMGGDPAGQYVAEYNLSELDDLNVLYVALTRAEKGLFIITYDAKGNNYGALFKAYFEHTSQWNPNGEAITIGDLTQKTSIAPSKKNITTIPYIYTPLEQGPQIATTSAALWEETTQEERQWGNLVHTILADIHTKADLPAALDKAVLAGDLPTTAVATVAQTIVAILEHPKLASYFKTGINAKNEAELMDTDGQLLRPDRLVFNKDHVTLIDYKTGKKNKSHIAQLDNYSKLLAALGFVVDHKILIYIGEKIEPVFL